MDTIASLGHDIAQVVGPTYQAYSALLQGLESKAAIEKAQKETISYGPHARQKLDLYTPPPSAPEPSQGGRPILLFTYGGAFISGDRVVDAIPGGLVYTNVANFFASEFGFESIVMDYRLLGHGAKYPSGGEDIGMALRWIQDRYPKGDRRDIYVLANSAGAVHMCTWLLGPQFAADREKLLDSSAASKLSKIALLGCPFRLDYNGGMHTMLEAYYGGEKGTKEAEPTALLLTAIDGTALASLPSVLTIVSEMDPPFIIEAGQEFSMLWKEQGGHGGYVVLDDHNHISPPLSLGTGVRKEEQWGHIIAGWFQEGTLY